KILSVEAIPIITSKEVIGAKIIVEGRVEYNVIYIPRDDSDSVNSVSYTEKFTNSLDLEESEHKIISEVECKIEHIDAKIMNERKISIEGVIDLNWEFYATTNIEFVKDIEASEGVEILKENQNIGRLASTKECDMIGKSVLRVGMDKPQISKILKCSLRLHKKEMKVGEDKVYLGCYCKINILYVGDGTNEIISLEDDVYISQDEEVTGVYSDMIPSVIYDIKNKDIVVEEDDLGEARIINIEFLVAAKISVFSDENVSVIKDAYSPNFNLSIENKVYEVGALLGIQNGENIIKDNIYLKEGDIKPEKIIGVMGNTVITDKQINDDKIMVEGIIKADVIYKGDENETVYSHVSSDIPFTTVLDMIGAKENMKAVVRAVLESLDAIIEANTIAIKASISVGAKVFYEDRREFIADVIEDEGDTPEKKSSITIYVVGKDDTLWSLAKKYNCKMEELQKINNMDNEEELEEGEKLIIPGRAVF
ncbi:MAG: DUF3794 domain-containing protein, partial [Clostridium sp.]|nr:DUF3794 domain-containing protein [Clostridium sp.]